MPTATPPAGFDLADVRAIQARAEQLAARARDAGHQLSRVTATATSSDGRASVTAGAGGILRAVEPGPDAAGASPTEFCAAIMDAYARASRSAAEQGSQLMRQLTGRDTQAMQLIREALPPDPDADRESPRASRDFDTEQA